MPDAAAPDAPSDLLVACLCAGWCTTCTAYRAVFEDLAARHPGARFVWVDIEDHSDALEATAGGAPDIENFPTLLLSQGGEPRFFGTVLPHAAVLQRLLDQAGREALPALPEPRTRSLTAVVQALADRGVLTG